MNSKILGTTIKNYSCPSYKKPTAKPKKKRQIHQESPVAIVMLKGRTCSMLKIKKKEAEHLKRRKIMYSLNSLKKKILTKKTRAEQTTYHFHAF